MPKKYFLAQEPILFNSLEEVASYVSELQKKDREVDLSGLVIGTLVGKLEQDTSFVIRNDKNKIKKVKVKVTPPPSVNAKPLPPIQEDTEDEEEEDTQVLTCSFCAKPKVKTIIVDKQPTHMCVNHLSIEKDVLNAGN